MALATLSIDIVAKLAGFEQGLDKANRLLEKQAADVQRRNASLQASAQALGRVLGGAFAGIGLSVFTKQTIDGLDALNDLRDATGASIENLSGLEDIAVRTGTSFETAGAALIKFNKELTDAKPGTETAQIVKALGLSAEELKKIDPAEALTKTAVALAQFADDGNKARIVQALFGKSVGEVAPLLKDLADKGKLVATVTTEQALAAEEFNKQLFKIQKNVTDAARALASDLLPKIDALGASTGTASAGFDLLGSAAGGIKNVFETIAVLGSNVEFVFAGVGRELGAIAAQSVALAKLDFKGFSAISDAVKEDGVRARAELDALEKKLLGIAQKAGGVVSTSSVPGLPSLPNVPEAIKKVAPKKSEFVGPEVPELLKRVQDRIDALPSAKIVALREELQRLISIRGVEGAGKIDEAIQNITDELQKFSPAAQLAAANAERLNALLAATPTSKIAAATADLDLLRARLAETGDTAEYTEAVLARFGIPDEALKSIDEFTVFAEQAGRNIQDALGSGVKNFLSGEYKSIGGLFKNLVLDLTSQALSAQLGKALLGDFAKSGAVGGLLGKGFGLLGTLFNADGNAFDRSGRITAFAGGGVFDKPTGFGYGGGQLGVLGEAGPEAIMPLRRGPGGKLGVVAQGGGGSSTIINNISVGAGVTRGEVVALLQSYGSSIKAEILSSQRNGGAFAR